MVGIGSKLVCNASGASFDSVINQHILTLHLYKCIKMKYSSD